MTDFSLDKAELAQTGRNPYFILEAGYTLVFDDEKEQLTITVLDEIKSVDGEETRAAPVNMPVNSSQFQNQSFLRTASDIFGIVIALFTK